MRGSHPDCHPSLAGRTFENVKRRTAKFACSGWKLPSSQNSLLTDTHQCDLNQDQAKTMASVLCHFSPSVIAQALKHCKGAPEIRGDSICPILDQCTACVQAKLERVCPGNEGLEPETSSCHANVSASILHLLGQFPRMRTIASMLKASMVGHAGS